MRRYRLRNLSLETAVGTYVFNTTLKSDTARNWYYVNGTFNYGGTTSKQFKSIRTLYYDETIISSERAYAGTPYLQSYYAKRYYSGVTGYYSYEYELDGTKTDFGIGHYQANIGA